MRQLSIKYPNKFRAILFNKSTAHVTICFSIHAGAEQESRTLSGASHIIERMIKANLILETNKFGGVVESSVDSELINWTISTTREHIEDSLKILSTAIFGFFPKSSAFEMQKAKVLQEIEKKKFNPMAILTDITKRQLYHGTTLSLEVIGSAKSVSELTIQQIKDFYTKILSPQNISLSIVGDIGDREIIDISNKNAVVNGQIADISGFDQLWMVPNKDEEIVLKNYKTTDSLNEIQKFVNNYFYSSTLKLESKHKSRAVKYISLNKPVFISKLKTLNQTRFQITFPSAPYLSSSYKYAKLIEAYLTYYIRGELLKELNVYSVDISVIGCKNNGHLSISFAVDNEVANDRYNTVMKLLKQIATEGISNAEFESLKNMYETTVSIYHESSVKVANRFNKWILIKDEVFNLNNEIASIRAMTYENFVYTLKHILDFNKILVVMLGRKNDDFKPF